MPTNKKKPIIAFPLDVLQPIRDYLVNRESELKKRKKRLEKEDPFTNNQRLNDNAAVDADAAEEVGHERVTALQSEVEKTLIRIRKALTRIKVGRYGICTNCGQMIDTDRLAIDPTASLCVTCAQRKSKKE
jgi:RNA polymerase-binding transcription factor DksA